MFSKDTDPVEKLLAYTAGQLDNLTKELAKMKEENLTLKKALSQLREENKKLLSRIEELENEVQSLKSQKSGLNITLLPKNEAQKLIDEIVKRL